VEGAAELTAVSSTAPLAGGAVVRRPKVWAAACLVAQIVFTLGWMLADLWQGPHYSAIRYTISDQTAIGAPHAWFLISCQLLAGIATTGFAVFGLRPALAPAGRVAAYAPWMLACGALAYLVIWPRLPCRLADAGCSVHQHLVSAGGLTDAIASGVLIGVLAVTPFPMWRRLRKLPTWRPYAPVMITARILSPLLLIATASQGPYAPGAYEGLFERALALVTAVWICTLALGVLRQRPARGSEALTGAAGVSSASPG
jgi:Protein of unknown function (DUF998)